MTINITGRKTIIKDQFREKAEKKLGKFDRFFGDEVQCDVVVTSQGEREKVEVSIFDNGMIYRGERTTDDRLNSLDQVTDLLFRQITKHRSKLNKKMRNNAFDDIVTPVEEDLGVIRTKRFVVSEMTTEEAILQMELIGHTFFLFKNVMTKEMNVVYYRNDGGYGLLEAIDQ